jgi:hypothetical protein
LLVGDRARHVVAAVRLTALTSMGQFNNISYKERRKKALPETRGVRYGWRKSRLGSAG